MNNYKCNKNYIRQINENIVTTSRNEKNILNNVISHSVYNLPTAEIRNEMCFWGLVYSRERNIFNMLFLLLLGKYERKLILINLTQKLAIFEQMLQLYSPKHINSDDIRVYPFFGP